MRILVTGGHGFIGSHILRQLVDDGHEVACFDISEPSPYAKPVSDDVEFYRGDITDPIEVYNALADFTPDRLIHMASLLGRASQADPRQAFAVNVEGTFNVLEAADGLDIDRVVAASSAAASGRVSSDHESFDESITQTPYTVYGLTKYMVERIGAIYEDQRGIEFAAIEPVHGLGPDRMRGNVEDAYIVKAAVSGTPITVPNIDHPVEIIYVGDEAKAFVTAVLADSLSYDRYIIGTGEQAALEDIVSYVRTYVPDADLRLGESRGDDQLETRPPTDTTRIRNDIGWEPTHSIEDAVGVYVEWLRENPAKWSFDAADVPWEE